jgi:gamma-glutamyl hydrolase
MSKFRLLIALTLISFKLVVSKAIVDSKVDLFATPTFNNEPIIGILSEEMSYYLASKFPNDYHSYIAASYVKFVEGGGARVVPIW